MKIFKFLICILFFDLIVSNIFLKNTGYWKVPNWNNKFWRISSDKYHHDILPNTNEIETWGGKLKKKLITNSIGFVDKSNREIKKIDHLKKRILLIGDSFIEGAGLDYEYTVAGLLDNYLGEKYDVLNSAVGSYSTSIYFKKTKYYLDMGYKFDQAIIFLDISDIFDELFIQFDEKGEIKTFTETKNRELFKNYLYKIGRFLRDNTVTFRFLALISDKTEVLKNYTKLKFKAASELDKKFLSTNRDDVMFYRMTHIDRGYWTFNEEKFLYVDKGLKQSEKYLIKLFNLLEKNNIPSTLIIYPWPTQIFYGDNYHEEYWFNFAKKQNIEFLSMYKYFKSNNPKKMIFDTFLYGDIHWNKTGTKVIFQNLIKNVNF